MLSLIRCPEIQHALVIARGRAGLTLRIPPKPAYSRIVHQLARPDDPKNVPSTSATSDSSISLWSPLSSDVEETTSTTELRSGLEASSALIDMYTSPGCDVVFSTLEAMVCVGDLQGVKDNAWVMLQRGLISEIFQLALSMKNGYIIAAIIDYAEENKLRLRLPVQQAVFSDTQTNLMRAAQAKEEKFQLLQADIQDIGKLYGSKTSCYCTALMTAAFMVMMTR